MRPGKRNHNTLAMWLITRHEWQLKRALGNLRKRVLGVEWESILTFGFTTQGMGVRLFRGVTHWLETMAFDTSRGYPGWESIRDRAEFTFTAPDRASNP